MYQKVYKGWLNFSKVGWDRHPERLTFQRMLAEMSASKCGSLAEGLQGLSGGRRPGMFEDQQEVQ